ncbi:MAG: hypothetical protein A2Y38_25095 [Spirochaetes bacterium GWB1_59_5]|nr:MAG: hypothetical protein A2Y38_25095 [Spirochaetes bacterium GWB1_59_5]
MQKNALGKDANGRIIRVGSRLRHPLHGSGWRVKRVRMMVDEDGTVVAVDRIILNKDLRSHHATLGVAIPEDVGPGGWRVMIGPSPHLQRGPR